MNTMQVQSVNGEKGAKSVPPFMYREDGSEYLRGKLDAVSSTLDRHIKSTDDRINRIEAKIETGFAQSQKDISALIKSMDDKLDEAMNTISTSRGFSNATGAFIGAMIVMGSSIVGAIISHFLK